MIISDLTKIGNNLLNARKKLGLTQSEVAEKAELSDRGYADIERGMVNVRIDTFLRICSALNVTPNDILLSSCNAVPSEDEIMKLIEVSSVQDKATLLRLICAYFNLT